MTKNLYCKKCGEKVEAKITKHGELASAWCSECGGFIISGNINEKNIITPDPTGDILIPRICQHCDKNIFLDFESKKYKCEYCAWDSSNIHIPPKYMVGILISDNNHMISFRKWTGEIIKFKTDIPKYFIENPSEYVIGCSSVVTREGMLIKLNIKTWSINPNIVNDFIDYINRIYKSKDNRIKERLPAGVLSKLESMK